MAKEDKKGVAPTKAPPIQSIAQKMAPNSRATQLADVVRAKLKDKEAIQLMGASDVPKMITISTGSIGLDYAIGVGGIPRGRIVEIYGQESSGKTTVALQCVADCQRQGGVASFIDAEHAIDLTYAANLGVKTEEMLLAQPSCGEEALTITEALITNGKHGDLVVVDSVAALTPRAEIEGDMGDAHMGLQARMMGQALRKIVGIASERGVTVIFINQIRMKLGVMFGSPETTTGGNALKFYATIRIEVKRIQQNKVGEEVVSNKTRAKVVKNKVAPPFRQAEFDIRFGTGTDYRGEVLDFAERFQILSKSGSWFVYKDDKFANGREAALDYLSANPNFEQELYSAVRIKLFPNEAASRLTTTPPSDVQTAASA
jgi:recombination protein RecA